MAKILMGPTGNTISGHVLDVSVKPFVETMRFTLSDPNLYVKWNPKKLGGWGCWEIRRKPEYTTIVDVAEYKGDVIFQLDYWETDIVHHVLDCAFLNYDQIRKLKEIDTFQYGSVQNWQNEMERRQRDAKEKAAAKAAKARHDAAKTYKNEIRAFKDYIRNGGNPHYIAALTEHVKALD